MSASFNGPELGVDANGCLTQRTKVDGHEVMIHYDDLPEADITTVHGIACTTALRTVIDIAADLRLEELETVVRDCLERGLFSVDQALGRLSQPDMTSGRGAQLLRAVLEN